MTKGVRLWPVKTMRFGDLAPWDRNPRQIDEKSKAGLIESLKTFGLADIMGVSKRDGSLISGHRRRDAMIALGVGEDEEVAVIEVDLPPDEETALRIELNNPHVQGAFTDALPPMLGQLRDSLGQAKFQALRMDDLLLQRLDPDAGGGKKLSDGEAMGAPLMLTKSQRDIVDQAIAEVRDSENDQTVTEGNAISLALGDWMAGRPRACDGK